MEKIKRRGKSAVNVIDVLLILIILAVGAVLAYVFVFSGRGEAHVPQMHTVRYVVELKNIRNEFAGHITVGEKAIDSVAMYNIGTVVAYEEKDATYIGTDLIRGEPVVSAYPERKNLYVTIEAQAYLDDNAYVIDGYQVAVGLNVGLKLPNFVGSGYCISLDVID